MRKNLYFRVNFKVYSNFSPANFIEFTTDGLFFATANFVFLYLIRMKIASKFGILWKEVFIALFSMEFRARSETIKRFLL